MLRVRRRSGKLTGQAATGSVHLIRPGRRSVPPPETMTIRRQEGELPDAVGTTENCRPQPLPSTDLS
ncbi:hypothetical protein HMPREF1979_00554 [Actinomyces johnsonii F0542]|uniref:Uncharacterized protein n=1 Tax=Actinomyces johnsonii F0542 TaxID=1321818 RepID=U1QV66_9ACTO|nr:hypothetical protein HMPREF1979_00554 [Actinomyces johnsonii F0542]